MKRLYIKMESRDDYRYLGDDVDRLVRVAADRGYDLSRSDAVWVWEDYSDSYAAGWLGMKDYEDDEIWSIIEYRTRTSETGEEDDE